MLSLAPRPGYPSGRSGAMSSPDGAEPPVERLGKGVVDDPGEMPLGDVPARWPRPGELAHRAQVVRDQRHQCEAGSFGLADGPEVHGEQRLPALDPDLEVRDDAAEVFERITGAGPPVVDDPDLPPVEEEARWCEVAMACDRRGRRPRPRAFDAGDDLGSPHTDGRQRHPPKD